MSRIYHKPHGSSEADTSGASRRTRTAWVGRAEQWLGDSGWFGYVIFSVASGLWVAGLGMLLEVQAPWAKLAGGAGLMSGGLLQILFARPLAQWRDQTPWLLRWYEEGWLGTVDYGPGTYRFFGSAVAGCGFGVCVWAVAGNTTAAIICGLCAVLGIWIWTWIAFTELDE